MAQYALWKSQLNALSEAVRIAVGDTIRVHQRLIEGEGKDKKERVQVYEGMVIAIKGKQENKSITVRKVAANQIGVERIWPLVSPWIAKIEVKTPGKVRRAKLYYVRQQTRKQLRKIKQHSTN